MLRAAIFGFSISTLAILMLAISMLACPADAAPLPRCAGPVEIAHAKVVRVERNGVLVLSDGRAVMLEGVRLARAAPGPNQTAVAPQVLAAIRAMTQGIPVTFTALRPKEDRYDRVRAQAFAANTWLQTALLDKGLARVDLSPDRGECAGELKQAEASARARHAGLWGGASQQAQGQAGDPPSYRVRSPQQMQGTQGTFQVVEGWVTSVGRGGERVFIDFGDDWRRGFSATIAPGDRARFRKFDLDGLTAHHVRLRGMVQDYRGRPEMVLSDPSQIEILN